MKRHINASRELKTIDRYKDMTPYFNESVTEEEMFEYLRFYYGIGNAESRVILSALTLAGARWKGKGNDEREHTVERKADSENV